MEVNLREFKFNLIIFAITYLIVMISCSIAIAIYFPTLSALQFWLCVITLAIFSLLSLPLIIKGYFYLKDANKEKVEEKELGE